MTKTVQALLVLGVLAGGAPLHAQERLSTSAKIAVVAWLQAGALDAYTTLDFRTWHDYPAGQCRLREGNPLISPLQQHPGAMIAVGAVGEVAAIYAATKLLRHHQHALTFVALTAAVTHASLAWRNQRILYGGNNGCDRWSAAVLQGVN